MQVSRCLVGVGRRTSRRVVSIPPPPPRFLCHASSISTDDDVTVFYRWPTMKHFRLISRMKMYQLGLMGVLLPPATVSYINGDLSGTGLTLAYVAAGGTLSILLSLSHLSTSIIGEMAYLPVTGHLKLSTLTFLGYRKDILILPSQIIRNTHSGFFSELEVKGHPRTFRYSIRYGKILDRELLAHLIFSVSD